MENKYSVSEETASEHNIAELAAGYADTFYKLTVVNINQKTADISAAYSFSMVAGLLCFFIITFIGIAAALWLGSLLGNTAFGFLVVGFFYLVVFLVLLITRKKIFYPFIKNLVIKSIYE